MFFAKLSIFLLKIKSERELPCSLWKNGILVLCGKYQLLPTKNCQFVDWIIPILGWVMVVFWLDNVRLIVGYSIENTCLSGQTAKQTFQTRFAKLYFVLGFADYTPSIKRSLCTKGSCSVGRTRFPRATILSTFL